MPAAPVAAPLNAGWADAVAKTDYAINEGDFITDTRQGPATLQEGDSGKYPWRDTRKATGIAFQRSEVKPAMVRDGLSMTYMIGEKYVARPNHQTAEDPGYDQSAYGGVDVDINRWVLDPPRADGEGTEEKSAARWKTSPWSRQVPSPPAPLPSNGRGKVKTRNAERMRRQVAPI
jgi:hypothetical protein